MDDDAGRSAPSPSYGFLSSLPFLYLVLLPSPRRRWLEPKALPNSRYLFHDGDLALLRHRLKITTACLPKLEATQHVSRSSDIPEWVAQPRVPYCELMDEAERTARIEAAEERERDAPIQTWWLSFAEPDGFLGVAIVRARGIIDAIHVCRERGCGTEGRGSVQFEPVPEGEIDERWYYRLLSADEVADLNAELAAQSRNSG